MTTSDDYLRDCVMAILRNITLHPENKVKFVREGGMPPLISLIRSLEDRVQEQAAVILRNLSVNIQSKVRIVKEGGLPPLVDLLTSGMPRTALLRLIAP